MEEEEPEYVKLMREEKERKELLCDALKNMELFDLKQEKDDEYFNEQASLEQLSFDQPSIHPPGIKFFTGEPNCVYSPNSMKNDVNLPWWNYKELDFTAIKDIHRQISGNYVLKSEQSKTFLFKFFYKLLFTEQTTGYLRTVKCILLELIGSSTKNKVFLRIALDALLPLGIKNIGGQVDKLFEDEMAQNRQDQNITIVLDQKEFSPVENIRCVINILQYLVMKEYNLSKGKVNIADAELDNLIFLLLAISQDPQILRSSVVSYIQTLLASILDLYPSDSSFLEKVQDLVERVIKYWDDSVEKFNHHTAFYVACDIIPLSVRGQRLKASMAFTALMCCVTPDDVEVFDDVQLSTLSSFCSEHADELRELDFHVLFSIVRLVDATIDRPFSYERDGKYLKAIMDTIRTTYETKECQGTDSYSKTRLNAFLRDTTAEWKRLLVPPEKSEAQKRKLPY